MQESPALFPSMADGEPFSLTVADAAAVVGMHPDTIRAWADEGKLACWTTPGGHRRFRRSDLLALLPDDGPEAAA